jgi:hypothetical protein
MSLLCGPRRSYCVFLNKAYACEGATSHIPCSLFHVLVPLFHFDKALVSHRYSVDPSINLHSLRTHTTTLVPTVLGEASDSQDASCSSQACHVLAKRVCYHFGHRLYRHNELAGYCHLDPRYLAPRMLR